MNVSGFTQQEFDCLKPVFDLFNLQNAAAQGNSSGVWFSVTNNGSTVATYDPTTGRSSNAAGVSFGLQINRQDLGPTFAGVTTTTSNDAETNLQSSVMRLSPHVTDCTAMQMTLAHELGHTLGLLHCDGCPPGLR